MYISGVVWIQEPMNGENRPLVTNEPVEVQDAKKITHCFKRIYGIYLEFMQTDTTYNTNRLHLETLGSCVQKILWPLP